MDGHWKWVDIDDPRPAIKRARSMVRAKVDAGTLPPMVTERLMAIPGSGRACSACDDPVGRGEMELATTTNAGRAMCFHMDCFTIWWKVTQDHRAGGRGPHTIAHSMTDGTLSTGAAE